MTTKRELFCLELGSEDGSDRHYFYGEGTQYEFEQRCNSLMRDAAAIALDRDQKSDYHHVAWEDIVQALASLLPNYGYEWVQPKTVYYNRGLLAPVTPESNWDEMVKDRLAGSYELLLDMGPKITEHNLKYRDEW